MRSRELMAARLLSVRFAQQGIRGGIVLLALAIMPAAMAVAFGVENSAQV